MLKNAADYNLNKFYVITELVLLKIMFITL